LPSAPGSAPSGGKLQPATRGALAVALKSGEQQVQRAAGSTPHRPGHIAVRKSRTCLLAAVLDGVGLEASAA